jgi:hypothetical protein
VEIDAADVALLLIEAYVVESFKAGTVDGSDTVVGHQEVLLPTHEDVLALTQVGHWHRRALAYLRLVRPERPELAPMVQVYFLRCAPILMFGNETILAADDLALKVRGQRRVVLRQTCDRAESVNQTQ